MKRIVHRMVWSSACALAAAVGSPASAGVLTGTEAASAPTLAQPSTAAQDAQRAWQAQDYEGAIEPLRQVVKEQPGNGQAWFQLGYALHVTGEYEQAIPIHKKAAEFPQARPTALYNLACAYALTDKADKAFKTLHSAAKFGMRDVQLIEQDSDLESLRGDERWDEFLGTVRGYAANPPEDALGFWVGSWDCYGAMSGKKAGTNTLAWRSGSRAIHESWASGGGFTGESWNWFDTNKGVWRQVWVDQGGNPVEFTGTAKDDGILFEAKTPMVTGGTQWTRMYVRPIGENWVRQTGTVSTDQGETWQPRYDLVYVPSGEAYSAEKLAEMTEPGEL
ncbi:MAG: tetratricopeptide repeat protein [Phycisphaerales bacterium JB037]